MGDCQSEDIPLPNFEALRSNGIVQHATLVSTRPLYDCEVIRVVTPEGCQCDGWLGDVTRLLFSAGILSTGTSSQTHKRCSRRNLSASLSARLNASQI